eukprot:SAG11_NODE_13555_length_649_cov_41.849091_2_plen_131_part_00
MFILTWLTRNCRPAALGKAPQFAGFTERAHRTRGRPKPGRKPTEAATETVSLETFRRVLAEGFGSGRMTTLVLTEPEWHSLLPLVDPLAEGVVAYKPFLNRCRLRLDALNSKNLRASGRIARSKAVASAT